MLGTIFPAKPAKTDPGNEADERHGWRLSQHQSRPAPAKRPGPDRRDLEYQETEAEVIRFAYLGLPARTGRSSTMSSAVTNPGCERTAGKITRVRESCKSNFSQIRKNSGFSLRIDRLLAQFTAWRSGRRRPQLRRPPGAGCRLGHGPRQDLERLRVRATKLEMEPIEIADLEDRGRCRTQDAHRRVGRGAKRGRQIVHVRLNVRFLGPAGDDAHDSAIGGTPYFSRVRAARPRQTPR